MSHGPLLDSRQSGMIWILDQRDEVQGILEWGNARDQPSCDRVVSPVTPVSRGQLQPELEA